jgi:hypothetical protein
MTLTEKLEILLTEAENSVECMAALSDTLRDCGHCTDALDEQIGFLELAIAIYKDKGN